MYINFACCCCAWCFSFCCCLYCAKVHQSLKLLEMFYLNSFFCWSVLIFLLCLRNFRPSLLLCLLCSHSWLPCLLSHSVVVKWIIYVHIVFVCVLCFDHHDIEFRWDFSFVHFFFVFFSRLDTHWWNTLLDACCQWHGYNCEKNIGERKKAEQKNSLVNCLASARASPWACVNVSRGNVILCYFQFYLYNNGLTYDYKRNHTVCVYKYKQQFEDNMWYIVWDESRFHPPDPLSVVLSFFHGLCSSRVNCYSCYILFFIVIVIVIAVSVVATVQSVTRQIIQDENYRESEPLDHQHHHHITQYIESNQFNSQRSS